MAHQPVYVNVYDMVCIWGRYRVLETNQMFAINRLRSISILHRWASVSTTLASKSINLVCAVDLFSETND